MERNAVGAFLLMLRNFLQGHTVNQESLVQCQGPAIIGALLRKVRPAEPRKAVSKDGHPCLLLGKLEAECWDSGHADPTVSACSLSRRSPAGPWT